MYKYVELCLDTNVLGLVSKTKVLYCVRLHLKRSEYQFKCRQRKVLYLKPTKGLHQKELASLAMPSSACPCFKP